MTHRDARLETIMLDLLKQDTTGARIEVMEVVEQDGITIYVRPRGSTGMDGIPAYAAQGARCVPGDLALTARFAGTRGSSVYYVLGIVAADEDDILRHVPPHDHTMADITDIGDLAVDVAQSLKGATKAQIASVSFSSGSPVQIPGLAFYMAPNATFTIHGGLMDLVTLAPAGMKLRFDAPSGNTMKVIAYGPAASDGNPVSVVHTTSGVVSNNALLGTPSPRGRIDISGVVTTGSTGGWFRVYVVNMTSVDAALVYDRAAFLTYARVE